MCSIRGPELHVAGLVLLLGCTADRGPRRPAHGHPEPVYGGDFLYADDDDIRTLDPAIAYDEMSYIAEMLIFNSLLRYDEDVRLEGDLAERWEVSDDGLTWTFHLRPGLRFHNGRPVVAEDVVYSWNRLFDPELASPGADFFGIIEGADAVLAGEAERASGLSAPDPLTVVARIETPDPTFANMVALPFGAVIPREEVEARGDRWAYSPVGTGPFSVESWELGERTVFVRNPHYHEPGLPYLDRVIHLARIPVSVQFMRLESDQLHQVNRLTAPDYLWVRRNELWRDQLAEIPSVDTYGEVMNTEMPPFDDVWFRRAVSTAIDRDKLRKLRNGRANPTLSWVPPALGAHADWEEMSPEDREYFQYQRFDPALSRECLARAGYPDGYPSPIEYWTLTSEASIVTALSVQQDLAQVGIDIEIKNVTFPAYLTATGRRNTVAMGYGAWVMDYPDPRNFLETKFHSRNISEQNSVNDSFYKNPEVDALLDAAAKEADPDARLDLYWQVHRIIARDAPYAFEYHSTSVSVTQPYIKNFRTHPVYTRDMRFAWLDLPEGRPSP